MPEFTRPRYAKHVQGRIALLLLSKAIMSTACRAPTTLCLALEETLCNVYFVQTLMLRYLGAVIVMLGGDYNDSSTWHIPWAHARALVDGEMPQRARSMVA